MTAERVVATGILGVAVVLWFVASSFEGGLSGYTGLVGPRFLPKVVLGGLILFIAFDLARAIGKGRSRGYQFGEEAGPGRTPLPEPDAGADFSASGVRRMLLALLLSGLYVGSMPVVGFLFGTLLFQFSVLFFVFRKRGPRFLVVAPGVITALSYLIFGLALGTPLPRGVAVFQALSRLVY